MCDAVGSMWLIGADGTGDASSICLLLLKDGRNYFLWSPLIWMLQRGIFWTKSWDSWDIPLIHPSNKRFPNCKTCFLQRISISDPKLTGPPGAVCYFAMEFNALRRAGSSLAEHTDAKTAKAMCCRGVWLILVKILFQDMDTWYKANKIYVEVYWCIRNG